MDLTQNPFYKKTAGDRPGPFPALTGDRTADVCVVGGGFAGLSAALQLAKSGLDVVLLERHAVGSGASGCNGGQLTPLETEGPDHLEKSLGVTTAREMWRLSTEALDSVKGLIAEYSIDCDLKPGWMRAAVTKENASTLRHETQRFRRDYAETGIEFVDAAEVAGMLGTTVYEGGMYYRNGIRVHPLKLVYGLARAASEAGVTIHEDSPVVGYSPGQDVLVSTHGGSVRAKRAVFACSPGLHLFESKVDKYVIEFQSHICVTAPLGPVLARSLNRDDIGVGDMFPAGNYFGLVDGDRLFFGNEGLLSETNPEKIKETLGKNMLRIYPQLDGVKVDYGWTGRGALTPNFMPHLGRLHDNVYFSQVPGIVWSLRGGSLIADAIIGKAKTFDWIAELKHQRIPGGHQFRKLMGKLMKLKLQRDTKKIWRKKVAVR